MDFQLSDDQSVLMTALDGLAERFQSRPTTHHGFALYDPELEQELAQGEFFDIAVVPDFGAVSAAMAVDKLARLPYAAEIALSMLVRPHLRDGGLPRPFGVIENGKPGRFAAQAKTLLVIDGDKIGIAHPEPGDIEAVESIYAYPMGKPAMALNVTPLAADESDVVRTWLRVALAAEAVGLIHGAIASTVEHISVRKQFGRPIGTFQALRHRMAECITLAGGLRWLMLKAALTGDAGDAALAAYQAQDVATRVCYETHQMLGAMGMTLEHPLHLWTYRLKALISELGGRAGQAKAVGAFCFKAD